MRALWLPDVLRDAGLNVQAVQGWEARGAELDGIHALLWHHDAVGGKADMPSLTALVNGRTTPTPVPGPLSQLGLGRSGKWYVIAAGKANHAGAGAWRGVTQSARTLGIEAANNGIGEPWPEVQVDSFVRGSAAILRRAGLSAGALCGHKEWALPYGRKIDPSFMDMGLMRARVTAVMSPPKRKVAPMWDPAPRFAAACLTPDGKGAWLVTPEGAVYTVGAAPFHKGPFEQPYFRGRQAAQIAPAGVGYVITATSGETYYYPAGT